ncbi:MAG TPA: hypothetical protein VMH30_00970 [Verrucomicrobiae bacterium]|nr:hypothetical protein [Verrucomicrobiae bacterium]
MNARLQKRGKAEEEEKITNPNRGGLPKDTGHSAPPFDEIQQRAETVTPVLKQILEFRPAPHWGIND